MSKKKEKNYEEEIKVILVGESGVGKTSLINSVQGHVFYEGTQLSTIISSFIKKTLTISDKKYCINLWDTIGQERYRSLTNIFLNGAEVVIFVFDITSKESFEQLDFWFDLIKNEIGKNVIKGIAANKLDLFEEQKVEEDLIEEYSKKKKVKYSYTTATDIIKFNEFLETLIKDYLKKNNGIDAINKTKSKKGKKLDDFTSNNSSRSKCC